METGWEDRGSCEDNGAGRRAWKRSGRMGRGGDSEQSQTEGTACAQQYMAVPVRAGDGQLLHLETGFGPPFPRTVVCGVYVDSGRHGGRR